MEQLAFTIPDHGQLTQLADDLYWARFQLPFRLNHINLYMIDGKDGWILIDAGISSDETKTQWQALLDGPLKDQPIAQIIITHHHVDHIGFAGPLAEMTGAPVFISEGEAQKSHWMFDYDEVAFSHFIADTYHRFGIEVAICEEARQNVGRFQRYVAPLPRFSYLSNTDVIISKAGKWHIRLDTGHTQSQIGLYDKDRGLYIAGDSLLPRISPNIPVDIRDLNFDMLGAYFTYLHEMATMDEAWQIFPGHDWPFAKGASRAKALISHHHNRLRSLTDAATASDLSVHDAMAHLFGKKFEAHEMYFAAGEARAHLTHLVATNQMVITEKDGVDYFALSHP